MTTTDFPVLLDDDGEGTLHVNITAEGLIIDLFHGDELIATWARTAQEFTEKLLEDVR